MPPKAKKTEPSKKTVAQKKDKVIEDKTFGLKNKKGAKQQKFIQHVTKQVKFGNAPPRKTDQLDATLKKKEDKKSQQEELNMLFRPVVQAQKVVKGVDPKSVLCAFYKQGQCQKGTKCKFSHDLTLARKGEKKSIYTDGRAEGADDMENWDEAKLEEVVNKKHGESNSSKPKTDIICKFFLEAVENSKYGWFWDCPNGNDKCHYKHALPPGFVLKKDKKKEEKEDEVSIEELIEKERAGLGPNTTKVTLETFLKWKERKKREKKEKLKQVEDQKKKDFKQGKMLGISGRLMFTFNPDLVADEDDEGGEVMTYQREEEDENDESSGPVREIDIDRIAFEASEADASGTVAKKVEGATSNGLANSEEESEKLDMAGALSPESSTQEAISAAMAATKDGDVLAGDVPIDENLFDGEDLDMLEEDLDTLELDD